MRKYFTIEGDTLDRICFNEYKGKQSEMVELVLEANPGLADYGSKLPARVEINLPDMPKTEESPRQTIRLWG